MLFLIWKAEERERFDGEENYEESSNVIFLSLNNKKNKFSHFKFFFSDNFFVSIFVVGGVAASRFRSGRRSRVRIRLQGQGLYDPRVGLAALLELFQGQPVVSVLVHLERVHVEMRGVHILKLCIAVITIGQMGSGCSTAVERMPHKREVVGLNPAGC